MRQHLTDLAIRQLAHPESGNVKVWDTQTPGFGVRLTARSKSFVVMFGKERRLKTIGRYPAMKLSDARTAAKRLLLDPETPRANRTLPDAVSAFLDDARERTRPKTVASYETVLKHAPDIKLTEASRKTVPVKTAHEIKAYKTLFNWLLRTEQHDKNPFAYLTATFGKRERVLTDEEVKTVWQYDHEPYSTIVKLLLLTGQRRSQIWKLEPEWIKGDLIHFPAAIMKTGIAHTIPIGPLTAELVKQAPFTFNGWSKAQARMHKHTGVKEWTLHDLRRTFVTMNARIGTPLHVTETYVAHRSGTISGVAAVYNRHQWVDEMRELTQRYEAQLAAIVGGTL